MLAHDSLHGLSISPFSFFPFLLSNENLIPPRAPLCGCTRCGTPKTYSSRTGGKPQERDGHKGAQAQY